MTSLSTRKPPHRCPNCEVGLGEVFYDVPSVPTHSVLLFEDAETARKFQKGDVALAHCPKCDFIWNAEFDAELEAYGLGYEATQAYSATFNRFHKELAEHVIKRFELRNKKVLEIGCGQGEFLNLLCELGDNDGVGFDPAFDPSRSDVDRHPNAVFIADFYSEKYSAERADLYCCKMTLEHIPNTLAFMTGIRTAIAENTSASLFFMIPNADYILDERAFWDVYYEHCSYFTPEALSSLITAAGFDVADIYSVYDKQYLVVEATVPERSPTPRSVRSSSNADRILQFSNDVSAFRISWKNKLNSISQNGGTAVVWGGGSKAVSFLTTIETGDHIAAAIDINPHKRGTYLPGTAHAVLGPVDLLTLRPDLVVVMNPIYMNEVRSELDAMGLNPEVLSITEFMPSNEPVSP